MDGSRQGVVQQTRGDHRTEPAGRLRLGPLLIVGLLASALGWAIYVAALPALWRVSWPYGLLFSALGIAQLLAVLAVLARPERRRALVAAALALAVFVLWGLARLLGVLPAPNPWVPANSVVGFTGALCAGLEALAAVILAVAATSGTRRSAPLSRRVVGAIATVPLVVLVLLAGSVGVLASSDGFAGAGFPGDVVAPKNLPPGQKSTVEYCRPDGMPLAMDLFMPTVDAHTGQAAPVAMYVHGGGGALGDRKMRGAGASLANHEGALFPWLLRQLNARGFVVASIDYRLAPGTPWPGMIEDAKCAVRFLRSHAGDLGIDPNRIGVWGSSAGANLSALLGLTGPGAGFDRGQYMDQSSAVQAVVYMFGVADVNDADGEPPFDRFMLQAVFGSSTEARSSASPMNYVRPGAPPFLILQGTEDTGAGRRQSAEFARRLQAAGVRANYIEVQGAGHGLNTPGQRPTPEELSARVVDFFVATLGQPT